MLYFLVPHWWHTKKVHTINWKVDPASMAFLFFWWGSNEPKFGVHSICFPAVHQRLMCKWIFNTVRARCSYCKKKMMESLHLCTSVASLVSQNTEEFKRSRLRYDFRGFFSCTHLKGTLCVTVSRWFFCRTFSFSFLGLSPFSISSIFVSPFPFMLAETIPGKPLSKLPSSLGFGSDGCIYTCWRLLCVSECYSVTCRENNDFR